ncbi:MAG: tetratricopeptide repeat protein [Alkalispirochaetaceae bacterium]
MYCQFRLRLVPLLAALLVSLMPGRAEAQMDMLPQIFRDLPPELQEGIPESMQYEEYRQLNRNVDFFTMFMSAIVPGYALFQVEKPVAAWTIVGTRVAGYAMMATAVARQWDRWRDLTSLSSIPDPRYQAYLHNAFLFAGGVVVNGMAWAFDVLGAYHVAKWEKDFVIYKYGIRETLGAEENEREIEFIRKLVLQDRPGEWQIRQELERSLRRYIDLYPRGTHRGEVEYYLGSLYAEGEEPTLALLHFARSLFLYPWGDFSLAARRTALSIIQRHRRAWPEDWELLISMFERSEENGSERSLEERIHSYLGAFQKLQGEEFRRLYVKEALRIAAEDPEAPFAADALFGAAGQLETLGRTEDAVVTYTQLAGLYPASEHWELAVLRVGELLSELNEPGYARRFYERLLVSAPESPEAQVAREALEE